MPRVLGRSQGVGLQFGVWGLGGLGFGRAIGPVKEFGAESLKFRTYFYGQSTVVCRFRFQPTRGPGVCASADLLWFDLNTPLDDHPLDARREPYAPKGWVLVSDCDPEENKAFGKARCLADLKDLKDR